MDHPDSEGFTINIALASYRDGKSSNRLGSERFLPSVITRESWTYKHLHLSQAAVQPPCMRHHPARDAQIDNLPPDYSDPLSHG